LPPNQFAASRSRQICWRHALFFKNIFAKNTPGRCPLNTFTLATNGYDGKGWPLMAVASRVFLQKNGCFLKKFSFKAALE
jgi:hypothetical protein